MSHKDAWHAGFTVIDSGGVTRCVKHDAPEIGCYGCYLASRLRFDTIERLGQAAMAAAVFGTPESWRAGYDQGCEDCY